MIEYICRPATKLEKKIFKEKNKEYFQNIKNKEKFQNVNDREIFKKDVCPSFYTKKNDICCPVKLKKGNCVPDGQQKTKAGGMPICALTYEAALKWGEKNDGAVIRLCSELPPATPPLLRKVVPPNCDKGTERIEDSCYPECPKGFISKGTKCIPKTYDRKKDAIIPPCPKNTTLIKNKCYEICPFGYTANKTYCVPAQLSSF